MPDRGELARYRANWQGEIDGAALYRSLAEVERQPSWPKIDIEARELAEAPQGTMKLPTTALL